MQLSVSTPFFESLVANDSVYELTRLYTPWLQRMLQDKQPQMLLLRDGYSHCRPSHQVYLHKWTFVQEQIFITFSVSFKPPPTLITEWPPPFVVARHQQKQRKPPIANTRDPIVYEGMAKRARAAGQQRWQKTSTRQQKMAAKMAALRARKGPS